MSESATQIPSQVGRRARGREKEQKKRQSEKIAERIEANDCPFKKWSRVEWEQRKRQRVVECGWEGR
jgi:hypothetical protein